jgi:tetratricopeptide (TPR) repeat protein
MSDAPERTPTPRGRASAAKHAWSAGAAPDALAVLDNDPELLADKSAVIDLAYEEYFRRWKAGAAPDPEEFAARFPAYQSSLRRVLLAHVFMAQEGEMLHEPEPVWPEAGQRLGDLTLLGELGRGNFARVFLAREASAGDRLVAVKLSREGGAEARMLGPLEHPNVVPVLSVRKDAATGLTAVVMPYRGSATLEDVLERAFGGHGAAPPRAALLLEVARASLPEGHPAEAPDPVLTRGSYAEGVMHLGAQVADALAYLHGQGVCHRDLKPSNVLLGPGGRPLLLDFNLSADGAAPAHLGGTVPYMAPEQLEAFLARGAAGAPRLDARADLFSLGVILYELLTGRHPFGPVPVLPSSGETARFLQEAHRRGHQPLGRGVDRRLARLIEGCLALDPAARPVSARAVAAALRRQLALPARLRRWAVRRPLAAACLAAVLALSGGGVGWAGTALVLKLRTSAEPVYQRGLAAYRDGKLDKAEELLNDAANIGERQVPEHLVALGLVRMKRAAAITAPDKKGEADSTFELAAADFEAALRRLGPARQGPAGAALAGKACAHLAYCRARLRHWGAAIEASKEAIRHGQETAEVLNNLGYCCSRTPAGYEKAAEHLDKALRLDAALTAARYNRAALAQDTRRAQGAGAARLPLSALDDIETVLTTKPAGSEPYLYAAWLYAFAARDYAGGPDAKGYARRALANLRAALEHGYSGPVRGDFVFRTVFAGDPEFADLINKGRPAAGPPAGAPPALGLVQPTSKLR